MTTLRPETLLFAEREARLADLDNLAQSQWVGGITHSQGTLEARLSALAHLRQTLRQGWLPDASQWLWPSLPIAAALREVLTGLDLPRHCLNQDEITDAVLMSILFHLDFIVDYQDRGSGLENAIQMALNAFREEWYERCGIIDELDAVLGLLPNEGKNLNWGQLRGLMQSAEWQSVLRIRSLLESQPELMQIIRGLGRSIESEEELLAEQIINEHLEEVFSTELTTRDERVPDMPGETRGIWRSDRITRMLPTEAVLLGHPHLRLVWHARRAERTLLVYEDDDHMQDKRLEKKRTFLPMPGFQKRKKLEQGPIIVCVDTSGSMGGAAESVAKAVVLEAMRTAHKQQRACHLITFGGPDEVINLELTPDTQGITKLAEFLGQSFRGGTDICGPLERVVELLEETRWRQADLLVASDGEFGATPELAARLTAAKHLYGLRIQGILVGDRETLGFIEIADHIHPVCNWRQLNEKGTSTEAPVHTHRLTSLYFPGALRGEAHPVTSPEHAANAVRTGRRLQ